MMYVVLLAMISTSLAAPQASTCPNGELIHCPHPGTPGQPARPTTRHCVPNRTCPTGQVPCVPPPPATGPAPCPPPAPYCHRGEVCPTPVVTTDVACPNGQLIHCPHPGTAGQPARPTTRHCVPNRTCPTGQEPCFPTPPATGRAPCPPPAPFCAEIGSCTS